MSTRQYIKRFFEPVQVARKRFFLSLLGALAGALYSTYTVFTLEQIAKSLEAVDTHRFRFRIIIFTGITLVRFIIRLTYKKVILSFTRDIWVYLDTTYLKKYLYANNNQTEQLGTGRMISITQKWVLNRDYLLFSMVRWNSQTVFTLILSIIYVWSKGYQYLFMALGMFVIVLIRVFLFANKAAVRRKKAKQVNIEFDRMFVRRMMSKFDILQQNRYPREAEKDRNLQYARYTNKMQEKRRQGICYDGATRIAELVMIGILIFIGYGVLKWTNSYADYVVIAGLSIIITKEVYSLADIGKRFSDTFVHITKLRETFDGFKQIEWVDTWKEFAYTNGNISIQDMTYGYGSQEIFTGFSCTISGSQKTAFVGSSGVGKSTLLKLLAGYLTPTSWDILVDDQPLSKLNKMSYYRHIGYLTQEPNVFDGTVRENLTYAVEVPDEKDTEAFQIFLDSVHNCIQSAKCEFIYEFPDQLQTEIGERGVRLSGGQRQRLAIAKIMLKNPNIILLDEPTSALDSFHEEAITEAMHNLFKGRTVIVAAHRLQTVKEAHEIIVLDSPADPPSTRSKSKKTNDNFLLWTAILERGTHKELLKNKGYYTKMLALQSGF